MLYVVKQRSELMSPDVKRGDELELEPDEVNLHIEAGGVLSLPHAPTSARRLRAGGELVEPADEPIAAELVEPADEPIAAELVEPADEPITVDD